MKTIDFLTKYCYTNNDIPNSHITYYLYRPFIMFLDAAKSYLLHHLIIILIFWRERNWQLHFLAKTFSLHVNIAPVLCS